MTLLTLEKVVRSFGSVRVLEGCTLQVEAGDRLGLVGDNGCGKTTLLRIMLGTDLPDEGLRRPRRGLRVAMAEQIPNFPGGCSVRDAAMVGLEELKEVGNELDVLHHALAEDPENKNLTTRLGQVQEKFNVLGGNEIGHRVEEILCGLGFALADLDRQVSTLSGGEKSRVQLAGVLLARADLLLFDEPTNHLDLASIAFLEGLLRSGGYTFLVVSHDRVFLDRVADAIVDLDEGKTTRYPGGYTKFAQLRQRELERQMKEWQRQQDKIAREEDYYRRYHCGQRSREARGRMRRLRRMEVLRRPAQKRRGGPKVGWQGHDPGTGYEMLRTENLRVTVGNGAKMLLEDVEFRVHGGERVGIVGPNGAGKTTLLRVLAGLDPVEVGVVERYPGVETVWFDQEVKGLHPEWSVLEEMQRAVGIQVEHEEIRSHLALFLFSGEEVEKRVGDLSGGEARRLLLAILTWRPAGMLFLDEPTNHLDIGARESLEEALMSFGGTVFFVSHDRYFLEKVATRILFLEPPRLSAYPGKWSEASRLKEERENTKATGKGRAGSGGKGRVKAKSANKKINQFKLEKIEAEIFALEERLEKVKQSQASPEVYQDRERSRQVAREIVELEAGLVSLYREWDDVGGA